MVTYNDFVPYNMNEHLPIAFKQKRARRLYKRGEIRFGRRNIYFKLGALSAFIIKSLDLPRGCQNEIYYLNYKKPTLLIK